MVIFVIGTSILGLALLFAAYRHHRVPLGPSGYIWDGTDGLHHVIVGGHQVGVWTKRRWAEQDLREQLRDFELAKGDL
jgi:hypothetical protein